MNLLTEIGNRYGTDRATVVGCKHNYTTIYNEYLEDKRFDIKSIFEIGTHFGAGLKMWQEYCPNANIYGMDDGSLYTNKKLLFNEKDTRIISFVGDQSNRVDLNIIMNKIGKNNNTFDFIIDDGGHTSKNHQISLGSLFPFLKSGGLYIIEDLFTVKSIETIEIIQNYIKNGKIAGDYFTDDEMVYIENNISKIDFHRGHWRGNSLNPGGDNMIKVIVMEKK